MATVYHYLVGADDVKQAANTMERAAGEMNQAASDVAETLRIHHQRMEEWLQRFEAAVAHMHPYHSPEQGAH